MSLAEFLPVILLGISIAMIPAILASIYLARGQRGIWKVFLFGWAGWLIALLVRILPVQVPQVIFADQLASSIPLALIYGVYSSAMAGLFEEGFRFFLLRRKESFRASGGSILSFGLGWGVGEALVIYVPGVASLPIISETVPSMLEILPGALERNLAIIAHISLTFIVLRSVAGGKRFLALAMLLHSILNIAALSTIILTQDVWLTELTAGVTVLAIIIISSHASRMKRAAVKM